MTDLLQAYGSAKNPDRPVAHDRPPGASDETVEAVGQLSAALEVVEHARGLLYNFHRLSGKADLALQEAVDALAKAGHADLADELTQVLVGRDVIPGMWTFQVVEAYDATYWQVFRAAEEKVRRQLSGGVRHVFEAEMKFREQQEPEPAAQESP